MVQTYLLYAVICSTGAKNFLAGPRRWDCSNLMPGLMRIHILSCALSAPVMLAVPRSRIQYHSSSCLSLTRLLNCGLSPLTIQKFLQSIVT